MITDRFSRLRSDIRFGWWKTRRMHVPRYVAVIVVIITLGSLAIFSGQVQNLLVPKVKAALGANYNNVANTLTIDGGGAYVLQQDTAGCGAGQASLWPLDIASSKSITYTTGAGTKANFVGKVCVNTTPTSLSVLNNSKLEMIGNLTFSIVNANSGGTITTAQTDSNGFAVPYPSRPDWYLVRYTGFIKMTAPALGSKYFWAWPSRFDDAMTIEWGSSGASIDTAGTFNPNLITFDNFNNCQSAATIDGSFVSSACAGGSINAIRKSVKSLIGSIGVGGPTQYIPFRVTGWEMGGQANFQVGWSETTNNASAASGVIAGSPTVLPIDYLYGPQEAGANAGLVDIAAPDTMRFEYATPPVGTGQGTVKRDLSNAGEYYLASRVNLSNTGPFLNFGKDTAAFANVGPNGAFSFFWNNPDFNSAGNPLSNTGRPDGQSYMFGWADPNQNLPAIDTLENYKLAYHDPAAVGRIAGINLTTSGDMTLNSGVVKSADLGLPGGRSFDGNGVNNGVSGVGGMGGHNGANTPGWYQFEFGGSSASPGTSFNAGLGGGGSRPGKGGGGRSAAGGGGGGIIGFGSAAYTTSNGTRLADAAAGAIFSAPGDGGGGLNGLGGAIVSVANNVFLDGTDHNSYNGTSFRGQYDAAYFDATPNGMGGGGGLGGDDGPFQFFNSLAGSGGGRIKLAVQGNLTVGNNSFIDAGGGAGQVGAGGGGGGMINVTVTNNFQFDNTSGINASGNSGTSWCNGGAPNSCTVPGAGGGGLIKVRAAQFNGTGWPVTYCNTPVEALQPIIGSLNVSAGDQYAEAGLIDLAFPAAPFCGSAAAATATDVQISKQIQQWNGTSSYATVQYDAAIQDVGNTFWSDSVTTVPSTIIRVKVSVRNPSAAARTVNVSDILPKGLQILQDAANNTVLKRIRQGVSIQDTLGKLTTAPVGLVGGAVVANNVIVPPTDVMEVMYLAQVVNPF